MLIKLDDPSCSVKLCPNIQSVTTMSDDTFMNHVIVHTMMHDHMTNGMQMDLYETCFANMGLAVAQKMAALSDELILSPDIAVSIKHVFNLPDQELSLYTISLIDEGTDLFFNMVTFVVVPDELDAFIEERFGDCTIREA